MAERRGWPLRWIALGLAIAIMVTSVAAGTVWYRARSRRLELAEARSAMEAGRYGLARQHLVGLAGQWPDDGEILLLLGECELERGRRDAASAPELGRDSAADFRRGRDAAMAAWARVPRSSPYYFRAALLQANYLVNTGKYALAEGILTNALAIASPDQAERYELERAASRLYRFEGRIDDVRRVLRASWCRSPDPAGVLRELWLLDYSPVPVEALQVALDKADNDDDRVWLGRGNNAILTGRFADAAGWLDRVVGKRPDDTSAWLAKLRLAQATEDLPAIVTALRHIPADWPLPVGSLRAWLAGRLGQEDIEQRELAELVKVAPGDARAVERLAILAFQAGQHAESEKLRLQKAEIDKTQDRVRRIMLDAQRLPEHAEELARLCGVLGRKFDAQAWTLVHEARSTLTTPPSPSSTTPAFSGALRDRAVALSLSDAESPPTKFRSSLKDILAGLREFGGTSPDHPVSPNREQAAAIPRFVDDAAAVGLNFTFDRGQTEKHLLPETMSGGVALLDFDGDGWLDVYCVQGGLLFAGSVGVSGSGREPVKVPPGDRLFRNRGDGTFVDVTESSKIASIAWGRGYGLGVTVGDYDNDGHPDLFVTRIGTYALYRNRGDGTFDDTTHAAGLEGRRDNPTSATFADLDNDGDLDLYVCHYMLWDPANPPTCLNDRGEFFYCDPSKVQPAPDHVFRNDRGRFVDVTKESGMTESIGHGLGVVAADLDDDNRIDLYVANDGTANYFFQNKGGFRFEDIALEAGVAGSASGGYQAGMGLACGDIDGDGRPDLLVTNFYGEGTTFYQNLGQGLFEDRSNASGLGLATRYLLGFGIALADVGNAGRRDVLITNGHVNDNRPFFPYAMPSRLYQNRPDGRLVDISANAGGCWDVPRLGRGLAAGDIDNDGRPDALILVQNDPIAYFHNRSEPVGRFIMLGLEGTASNRDGIGARVTVMAGGRRQVAQRVGGGSYQSSNDPRLHFGLGASERVDSIEVRWPSGKVDVHKNLAAGSGYLLREGESPPKPLAGFSRRPTPQP